MKSIAAIIVFVGLASVASWIPSGPVVGTDADLTNAIPTDVHPFVLRSGDDGPLIGYRHTVGATNDVDAPWVLPARGGGRWMAVPPRAERVRLDGATNGSATIYSGLASVIVSTGALAGNLTYVLATNSSAAGGAPGHGRTVRVTRAKTAVDGGYSVTIVASATTNAVTSGGWAEYSWTGAAWVPIGSGDVQSGQSVQVVEQDINSTAEPIEVGQVGVTHYFFTGSATNTGPQTYHLPTNNVSAGAVLSITIVGTNSHPSQPILYDFVASGVTNRLYDSNRVDFVWTGSTWRRKPLLDQTFPFNGYLYAVRNGEAFELPIQSDAPADGNEYSRKNNGWVVSSGGGGGGGGTNHNALTGLQGGTTGEYYHLTSVQHTDLTDAGDSALHYHSSDRSRAVHTGTQLMSTISDWATNTWSKITSVFQRGNGVHFSTNAGANTLTISGWYLPGANTTFTTNSDGSITIAGAAGGGSTNGTPFAVNGGAILTLANLLDTVYAKWAAAGSNITLTITNLPQASVSNLVSDLASKQAANTNLTQLATIAGSPGDILYRAANGTWTNLGAGSTGQGLIVTNGAPRWMDLPAGGGGGSSNILVNGGSAPPRLTNSTSVTWATNSNGDIYATAAGGTNVTYTTNTVDIPLLTSTDTVSIADSLTNETSLIGTMKAGQTKMLAANRLVSHTVLRVRARGLFSASDNWTGGKFRVRIGGRILSADFDETDSLTPTGLPWAIEAYLTVNATGNPASNTVVGSLSYGYGNPTASVGASMIALAAAGTLDTTVTNAVDVTFQNSSTQPVTLTCSMVEVSELAGQLISGGSAGAQSASNPWESAWVWSDLFDLNGVTSVAHGAYPWGLYVLGGSSLGSVGGQTNHPGVVRFASSASALSGAQASFRPSAMTLAAGSECTAIFRPLTTGSGNTVRFGWLDNTTPNSAANAVYVEFSEGYISGRVHVGSTTPSVTSVTNAFSANTWYRAHITIGPDSDRVAMFTVTESDTGSIVYTNSLGSLPAQTVGIGHAFMAFVSSSPGSAVNLCELDFIGLKPGTTRR